jgi:hypothetical protein
MRRLSLAFGLALGTAALLCAACGGGSSTTTLTVNGNRGGKKTYVSLSKDASGTCVVSPGVGTLGAKKNGKITWLLSNDCDTTQYVVATHYQEEKGGDPTNLGPVETNVVDPDPAVYNGLNAGDDDKKLDATIIKTNGTTKDILYKYWICTSASAIPNPLPDPLPTTIHCLDPDADVWP